jgi:hypothetical protein
MAEGVWNTLEPTFEAGKVPVHCMRSNEYYNVSSNAKCIITIQYKYIWIRCKRMKKDTFLYNLYLYPGVRVSKPAVGCLSRYRPL